jgi:ribosomal protein S18 acetylase RimI-like enzyme
MNVEIVQLTRDGCYRALESLIAISGEEQGFAWTSEHLLHDMPGKWTLSALARDTECRVIGYQVTSLAPGHPHLHRVMVSAGWRNAGVGRLLMAWLCRACVAGKWRPLTLKVHESNDRAVAFYRRLGFAMHDTGKVDMAVGARLLQGTGEPARILHVLEEMGPVE